jgi:hypothetical protein
MTDKTPETYNAAVIIFLMALTTFLVVFVATVFDPRLALIILGLLTSIL